MAIQKQLPQIPEIWAGQECTINRVGENFFDQLSHTDCYEDDSYIDAIHSLGVSKVRFPILWEKHQPAENQPIDWSWARARLAKLESLHISPIAGLLHHGSGPAFTSLADPDFPVKLAAYAEQVAKAFPRILYYTPVNEPLTTARFSGLYGLWYPHGTDDASFMKMLVNQLKGVVLSMRAIRKVNPSAQLVQTEDLAKVHSTPLLAYQRNFENRRRWLSYDLLCGKVNSRHPLYRFCLSSGISSQDLQFFTDNPCPPDILGLNYYVTSERYLDEDLASYPAHTHGGNGRHRYADTEAVRAGKGAGLTALLKEAWNRYRIPLAVTEVHLGCTREEQLRWFDEIRRNCLKAIDSGVELKAITAWSVFGSYDWNSLLTRKDGHYETGLFDTRNGRLRKTALGKLVTAAATGGRYEHPLMAEKGWWRRPERLYRPIGEPKKIMRRKSPPLLITGKTGTLGQAFARICQQRNIPFELLSRAELDITRSESVEKAIDRYRPWALVNTAGYVRVDDAEYDIETCFRANALAPGELAAICRKHSIPMVTFSSDLVFDGNKQEPYTEDDAVAPLNQYGQSKVTGERLVATADPSALIIRTSSFFGPWDRANFAHHILDTLRREGECRACDLVVSPTYVPDLVHAALDLLIDEEKGIWHVCNDGSLSWADFAIELAMRAGFSRKSIIPCSPESVNWVAKRPAFSAMKSSKGLSLRPFEKAVDEYFEQCCG